MLNFYKTIDNRVRPISVVEDGCWVCAICPTEQEVRYLVDILGLEQDFVRAALDEEESSRVESEEDQTLVIVDVPTAEKQDEEKNHCLFDNANGDYYEQSLYHHCVSERERSDYRNQPGTGEEYPDPLADTIFIEYFAADRDKVPAVLKTDR